MYLCITNSDKTTRIPGTRDEKTNLCLTGKIEGTGTERLRYMDSVCRRTELQMLPVELLKHTQDRAL